MDFKAIEVIRGPGVVNSPLPFSPAIRAGDFVFMSGMASADENGRLIPDSFENETRRTLENVGNVLAFARRSGTRLSCGQTRLGCAQSHLSRILLGALSGAHYLNRLLGRPREV